MMRNVLLGSAGTGTAFAAACALRKVWGAEVKIVAIDTNPKHLCTTSLLAEHYQQMLPFNDKKFPAQIAQVIHDYEIDTYLPLFPQEILVAIKYLRDNPNKILYKKLIPSSISGNLCADKLKLMDFLNSEKIPVPHTSLADKPFDSEFYFMKPRCGQGSKGARGILKGDLDSISENDRNSYIVQELCQGPEITVDAFSDSQNIYTFAICRERIEVKNGVCTKARVFVDDELLNLAKKLSSLLALEGCFCFQIMRDSSGRNVVTDLNPRPGAGTAISVATGNDFFAATFANAWEQDYQRYFSILKHDTFVTRQFCEFIMPPLV